MPPVGLPVDILSQAATDAREFFEATGQAPDTGSRDEERELQERTKADLDDAAEDVCGNLGGNLSRDCAWHDLVENVENP